MFKMSPMALDASTKTGVPLLHCSINDTLISRIPHCQNVFTELINVLDLTFGRFYNPLQWLKFTEDFVYRRLSSLLSLCYMQNYLCEVLVATFHRCGGQSYSRLFPIFFWILHTKNYKNRIIFTGVINKKAWFFDPPWIHKVTVT